MTDLNCGVDGVDVVVRRVDTGWDIETLRRLVDCCKMERFMYFFFPRIQLLYIIIVYLKKKVRSMC
jgi:hypothetical protein